MVVPYCFVAVAVELLLVLVVAGAAVAVVAVAGVEPWNALARSIFLL